MTAQGALFTLLAIAVLLVSACGTPAAPATSAPTPTETSSPTATPTAAPTASPTCTLTSTATVTPVPTATSTATPSPTPRPEERLPQEPNQPFTLLITEEELTALAEEEATHMPNAHYDQLAVGILPDKVLVSVMVEMLMVPRGVQIEAEGMPIAVDGTVRFRIDQLAMLDEYQQLTDFISTSLVGVLERALYFLKPTRRADIRAVDLTVTRVRLQPGAMVIEGMTE